MRHGYFVPLRHAEETEIEKESKSKQVAYCLILVLGGQSAKVMSEVIRGELAWFTE